VGGYGMDGSEDADLRAGAAGFLGELYGPGARDQRLELFGQGQWADEVPGSAWLALQASDVSRPEVLADATDDEVLGVGRAWKALETWVFARKLAVVRELIRRNPLDERWESGGLPREWEPQLHHEVAAALAISPVAAGKLVHLAWTLDARLRGVGQALEDGMLDPPRVRLIVDGTSVLEDEALFAKAERIILDGLPDCRTWSALERLVQRAVITVDPDGAQRRREKAQREHARLRLWREAWGTCAMQATGLPPDEALAANARIEGRAREYKAAGVRHPMDLLRVMAFADLINGVTVAQRAAWAQADDRPEGDRPEGDGPEGDGPDADGPDGDGPGGPDGGAPDDGSPGAGDDGYPADWPADDSEIGDGWHAGEYGDDDDRDDGLGGSSGGPGGRFGGPDDGPLPEAPCADSRPGGRGNREPAGPPCPACGGAGGGIGLPVRASLTVPAGALDLLAEWSVEYAWHSPRGPTGSGGGGPGGWYRGGPGPCPECGAGGASMPVREYLAFPLLTLAGLAQRPGEAHGLGALDPALVRDLTAAGARHPGSRFCITVADEHGFAIGHGCCTPMRGKAGRAIPVDPGRVTVSRSGRTGPEGGHGSWIITLPGAPLPFLVDIGPVPVYDCDHRHEAGKHDPGDTLRHLVQVRDGQCSFPTCARQARESDFEHATAHHKGGRTCGCNAHACSRSCHRAKQAPGWRVTKPRPGWTQWTTKAGRSYLQGPWRYQS
jgi:hypothetical protein